MNEPLILRVRNALSTITDPAAGSNIIASGAIRGLAADEDGRVRFTLEVSAASRETAQILLNQAKSAASAVDGVKVVTAVATAVTVAAVMNGDPSGR